MGHFERDFPDQNPGDSVSEPHVRLRTGTVRRVESAATRLEGACMSR